MLDCAADPFELVGAVVLGAGAEVAGELVDGAAAAGAALLAGTLPDGLLWKTA